MSKTKTRLVIRDVIVDNFKSYAGIHRIGPFHKTFTAVIGPNGSGKSNVIDSLLFVFGKNAKKIRLDKLSSLIHSSAAFPNLTHASVTVNFVEIVETEEGAKDPDDRNEVPNSEFSIKRDVSRSNQSNYFIDNQRATQKEVVALLTSKGVDLEHNRFLILQGEVEQIALMKPKAEKEGEEGLLEYFDDLIGTTKFIETINEAQVKAAALQEERLSALDRKNKLEAERDLLASGKQFAIEFLRKENALQDTITTMVQIKRRETEAELQVPLAEIRGIEEELNGTAAAVDRLKAQADAFHGQEQEQKKMIEIVAKEIRSAEARKQAVEEEKERLKANADEHDKLLKKEHDKQKKARDEIRDLEMKLQDAERNAEVASTHSKAANERMEQLLPIFEAKSEELQAVKKPVLRELEVKRKELAPFEGKVVVAEQARVSVAKRIERLDEAAAKRTLELQKHEAELAQKATRLRDLDEILRTAEAGGEGLAQKLAGIERQLEQVTRAKYSVNAEIEAIKKEFRESQADDKIVDFLKKQKSLEGCYFGTLRQLGSIAEQYDIAAGVASIMWGYHVVTTAEAGTKVLGLLRDHDMGRATVIVLDQVKAAFGDAIDRKFHAPEGTQRLFDLITVKNPLYLPAFFSAVRDTLVCDNLSLARKVGLGAVRHRVVTLKGELVEPQGAMTGGGHVAGGAKLRASHVTMDKEEARQLLPALQQKLDAAVQEEKQLMEALHDSRDKSKAFSPDHVRKLRQERAMVQGVIDGLRTRIADLQQEMQSNASASSQRSELQKELRQAEIVLEKAQKDQLAFKLAVEKLEEQLESIGGPEFQEMQREVAALKKRVAEQEKAVTDHKRNASKLASNKERREAETIEIDKRIQQLHEDATENAKEELAKLCNQIEACVKDIRQKVASKTNLEGDLAAVKKNIENIAREIKAGEIKMHELEDHLKAKNSAIAKKREELSKLDERIVTAVVKVRENLCNFGLETLHITLEQFLSQTGLGNAARGDASPTAPQPTKGRKVKRQRSDSRSCEAESDPEVDPRRRNWRERRDGGDDEDLLLNMEVTMEQLANFHLKKPESELDQYNIDELKEVAREYHTEIQRLRDTIDLSAVKSWKMKNDESKKAKAQYEGIVLEFNKVEKHLEELKKERCAAFMATFQVIQAKLREMYQLLANGGDAELQLVETEDPFEGINFVVRPPRKSWKQVGSLSGGEKTLSSLALVFALHHVKPTPIYVLDEIDAALDYANVSIVARYVLQHSVGAQFIIISLRNNMFELAHQLVGICKVKDVTNSLALNPRQLRSLVERKLVQHAANQSSAVEAAKKRLTQQNHQV